MLTFFASVIPCLPPPDITHGSHNALSGEEFFFGLKVTYKCDPGFSLIGEASVFCTTKDDVNGEWSGPAPECKVVKCPEPEVKNGKKHSGFGPDYSYGNIVIFECESGYTLTGSSSVKCEANNSWVPSLPTCLRKYKQLCGIFYMMFRKLIAFEILLCVYRLGIQQPHHLGLILDGFPIFSGIVRLSEAWFDGLITSLLNIKLPKAGM
uniref:Sushi domain-containing protein n=1 Tax=Terrapene triunguis TaxID=2587831 RepID=A0A674JYT5_9SAUR